MYIDDLLVCTQPLRYNLSLYKPCIPYQMVAALKEAFNIEFSKTLKEVNKSRLTFVIPYYLPDKTINHNFSKLQTAVGYVVYVERYSPDENLYYSREYMLIQSVTPNGEDKLTLEVTCVGLEQELEKKLIVDYSGVKVMYRTPEEILAWTPSDTYPTLASFVNSGILNVVCNLCPSWSVGTVDSDISLLYRYIQIDSSACLDFLINDVQNSFVCLFSFDSVNKQINCYNLTHLGTNKGFFISDRNYIKSLKETIDFDYVVTKLYIYGNEDLTIRSVNPTGEDYILNFDHFRSTTYMSQSLLSALDDYDILLESHKTTFQTLLTQLNTYMSTLSGLQSQLELLDGKNGTLEQLNTERDGIIAREESTDEIDAEIDAVNDQIDVLEGQITTAQTNINNTNTSIQTLQTELLLSNNFTLDHIKELDHWTIEKIVTDTSYTDAKELYDQGIKTLSQINQPSVQIEVDVIDLFSMVETQLDWDKVALGDMAYVRYGDFNINVELRLISYSHNYESEKLTLTFANRNNLNDPNMIINEILKTTNSTSTTLDINQYKYLSYINSGDKSKLNSYITNILDLAAQGALAGGNSEIKMDARGIVISDPSNPNAQVRIMYNGIYCTNDGWQTAQWALTGANGINAQILRGVVGEFCTIYANKIVMNGNLGMDDISIKMSHTNGDYTELTPDGLLRYVANPIYSYTPTGISTQENFTTHNTIALLQDDGWEFGGSGNYTVTSNRLVLGVTTTNVRRNYGRVSKYITKSDNTFSFVYNTGAADSHAEFYLYIDSQQYTIGRSSTDTTWSASTYSITLDEGWHTFEWYQTCSWNVSADAPVSPIIYIGSIVFESNKSSKEQTGTSTTGKNYQYLTATGSGGTNASITAGSEDIIPPVWVQLPDEFKGKDFIFNVFVADSGSQSMSYAITRLHVYAQTIDYDNAVVKVGASVGRIAYGYNTVIGNYSVAYYTGCDFAWIATV